jgi:threonine 3-dehydrogenase
MRKPVVFITGANGEIGHGLITRLAEGGTRSIVTLDLAPLEPALKPLVAARVHRVDPRRGPARAHPLGVRGRPRVPPRRPALDALGVHAGAGARGERAGHAAPARVRAARGRVARPDRPFLYPSSVAAYGLPDLETKHRAGKVREDDYNHPTTMYGANKLYCEQLGNYYARHYKQLAAEPQSGKVDFRCVRFPGLISAMTVPSGGTSDFAPEMIHAAARGDAYACFVRPDTRIPFMAMPDGVEALLRLAEAPRDRLSRTAYNVTAFNPSAEEIRDIVLRAFPEASHHVRGGRRSARASSTRGRRTWTMARPGATGASPRRSTCRAPSTST